MAPLTTVADRRSPGAIGRQARLELVFALKRGRTALVHAYAEPPHHIGQARSAGRALAVTIVCTGPGVFSGDDLRQSIRVESGAQALLSSQAALQVHAGVRGCDAQVRQRYDVEADGELHCRWDPVIPFAGARFSQDIDLQLAASSRLYWSDALMSGRVGRGESWASTTLSHHLRLSVDDRLTYLERYRLDPPRPRAVQPWLAASASFFGTALIYHPAVIDDSAEPLQRALNQLTDVRAGVDLADTHLIVGRIAAWRGETFRVARTMTREWAAAQVFADPALRFRR